MIPDHANPVKLPEPIGPPEPIQPSQDAALPAEVESTMAAWAAFWEPALAAARLLSYL